MLETAHAGDRPRWRPPMLETAHAGVNVSQLCSYTEIEDSCSRKRKIAFHGSCVQMRKMRKHIPREYIRKFVEST